MLRKKWLFVLVLVTLLLGFSGCSKTEKAKEEKSDTGRYVEKQITLSESIKDSSILQIGKENNHLIIYTMDTIGEKVSFTKYTYENDNFSDTTPDWLKNLDMSSEEISSYGRTKIIENINNNSYLYCTVVKDDNWIGHLYCTTDGKTVQDITPSDWLTENEEYHFYECPQDVAILDNNEILGYFYSEIRFYDSKTGEKKREIPLMGQHGENVFTCGDAYYLLQQNDNLDFAGIECYKSDSQSPLSTISCSQTIGTGNFLDICEDKSLILTGESGIFKQESGTDKWIQIVNGIYTSFAIESLWCTGMTAVTSDEFYGIFRDDTGETMLMEYVFDPSIASKPETTLKVYSVYDNPTVKQAAAMYTKENPNVVVEVETAVPSGEEETADMSSILQELNTKLIAGEGADVLVLDGLNSTSFREKGMLEDISDIVIPMTDQGELLKNITDCYKNEDGSIYQIPLKFSMNLLIGEKIDAVKGNTLEGLAEEISLQQDPVLGPMTAKDMAETFVPYMVSNIVDGNQLNKDALTQKLTYLKMIADNGGLVEAYPDDERKWNIWNITTEGGAAFYDTSGFLMAMLPVAMTKQVNGTLSCYENAFKPIGEIGINSSSESMETAKEFLKYLLSFDIQDSDFYDGFPINSKALDNQIAKDRSGYAAYTEIELEGGEYVGFTIGEIDEAYGIRLLDLCRKVNKKVIRDEKIETVISQVLPSYVNSYSLEDTVTQIEKGLNMYLAE